MAKEKVNGKNELKPEIPEEAFRKIEVQVRRINFLNDEIKVVQDERHLSQQMEVDFDKEHVIEMFDEMKQLTKEPLLSFLNQQVTLSTNLFKNLTHEVL